VHSLEVLDADLDVLSAQDAVAHGPPLSGVEPQEPLADDGCVVNSPRRLVLVQVDCWGSSGSGRYTPVNTSFLFRAGLKSRSCFPRVTPCLVGPLSICTPLKGRMSGGLA